MERRRVGHFLFDSIPFNDLVREYLVHELQLVLELLSVVLSLGVSILVPAETYEQLLTGLLDLNVHLELFVSSVPGHLDHAGHITALVNHLLLGLLAFVLLLPFDGLLVVLNLLNLILLG